MYKIGPSCSSSTGALRFTICQLSSRSVCLPIQRERFATSRGRWFQLASLLFRSYCSLLIVMGARPRERNSNASDVLIVLSYPPPEKAPEELCLPTIYSAPAWYQLVVSKYLYPLARPMRST